MGAPQFQVQSVAELQARGEAERAGRPFVMFRDGAGRQQLVMLPDDGSAVPIGRGPDRGVRLDWDREVSRVHALLEPVGGAWTIVDDGLSSNGTYVNGTRLDGRRRLDDGDALACGSVLIQYRSPVVTDEDETLRVQREAPNAGGLSPAQRRVLIALCRPLRDTPYGPPATNKEIAAELHLSVDAVKTHLRRVAEVLEIVDLPQNQKRAQLAWKAVSAGVVTPRELLDA
jgi:pSer/pThr/pTyr-binding forkhead associated (FHA) protein